MSSILKALKKLEDETGTQENFRSLDTKAVVRKKIPLYRMQGQVLAVCVAVFILLFVIWAVMGNNPFIAEKTISQTAVVLPDTAGKSPDQSSPAVKEMTEAAPGKKPEAGTGEPGKFLTRQKSESLAQNKKFLPSAPDKTGEREDIFRDHIAHDDAGRPRMKETVPAGQPDSPAVPATTVPVQNMDNRAKQSAVSDERKQTDNTGKNPMDNRQIMPPVLPAPANPLKTEAVPPSPLKPDVTVSEGTPGSRNMPAPETNPVVAENIPAKPAAAESARPKSFKPVPVPSAGTPGSRNIPIPETNQVVPEKKSEAPSAVPSDNVDGIPEKTSGETGLQIQALVWSEEPEGRIAVINGSIVRQSGAVGEVTVSNIGIDFIIFRNKNEQWKQKFRLN